MLINKPIPLDDWYLLRQLKEAIKYHSIYGDNRHKRALDTYRDTYKITIDNYLIKEEEK